MDHTKRKVERGDRRLNSSEKTDTVFTVIAGT